MSKNMIRAGQSSMIYDFFMYGGKRRAGAKKCAAEESVLRLVEHLPKNKIIGYFLTNEFRLLINLHYMGILVTATFRSNRTAACPLMVDKDLNS